ncbi:hypothetical protein C9374_013301 [Naegleria lovaniensis]|uniref:Importin subunit alpha n=1 Tax=Naegleria lovaniensis TaxID=51637 RepID=A0AA88H0B2_NAELO|nr:uncharacterized protein C9374_013301 [Naegleria lovaniensis]KAG2391816.1 hypothetical protein C9374_013301 [Naegleria lovaniensis]
MASNHIPTEDPTILLRYQQSYQERENLLDTTDPLKRLSATCFFRKFVSLETREHGTIVDHFIQLGIVPKFIEFLMKDDEPHLQFESAWVITGIASGSSEHTQLLIQLGAVPMLIQLLSSPNDDVKDQAVWALANIAGDGPATRNVVLRAGILAPLLKIIEENPKVSILRNATWAVSNLFRGKPFPDFDLISPSIPVLAQLLFSTDEEILVEVCWAFSFMTAEKEGIERALQANVTRRLVELMGHSSANVVLPALRTIGNIVSGNDSYTQTVINCNALSILCQLLSHSKNNIRKEACWTVSNITAGSVEQIQAVIDATIIPKLIMHIETSTTHAHTKSEAIWAILNAINGGNFDQILYIIEQGDMCLEVLSDLLLNDSICDEKLKNDVLRGLSNIARACRANGSSQCFEDMLDMKGLWHEVMYNNFRGTSGYEKKFVDNLRKPNTQSLCDSKISFKDEMEDD